MDHEISMTRGNEVSLLHGESESHPQRLDTSSKIGRKYELQRKIDEELRKLRLSQAMEQEKESESAGEVANDNNLSVNGKEMKTAIIPVEATVLSVVEPDDLPTSNEINTVKVMENGECEANENQDDAPKSPIGIQSDEIITPETHGVTTEAINVDDIIISSSDGDSSLSITSQTTTAGTFILPVCSPDTERELDETLPSDQIDQASRDRDQFDCIRSSPSPLQMDVSEASSDVFLTQDDLRSQKSGVDETPEQPTCSPHNSPENTGKEQESKSVAQTEQVDSSIDISQKSQIVIAEVDENKINAEDKHVNTNSSITHETIQEKLKLQPDVEEMDVQINAGQGELTAEEKVNYDLTIDKRTSSISHGVEVEVEDEIGFRADSPKDDSQEPQNVDAVEVDKNEEKAEDVNAVSDNTIERENVVILQPGIENTAARINAEQSELRADENVDHVLAIEKSEDTSSLATEVKEEFKLDSDQTKEILQEQQNVDAEVGENIGIAEDKDASTSNTLDTNEEVEIQAVIEYTEVKENPEQDAKIDHDLKIEKCADETKIEEIMGANDGNYDRKVSTDEDDYSGYDVDVCESMSYQEDISIADSEDQSAQRLSVDVPKPACDGNDELLFADVRYTVGEGIKYVEPIENVDVEREPASFEQDTCPEIVPWDTIKDDISLEKTDTFPVENFDDSVKFDEAYSCGSSHRSSLESEDKYDGFADSSERIAEDIVKEAVKAASASNIHAEAGNTAGEDHTIDDVEFNSDKMSSAQMQIVADSAEGEKITTLGVADNLDTDREQKMDKAQSYAFSEVRESEEDVTRISENGEKKSQGDIEDQPLGSAEESLAERLASSVTEAAVAVVAVKAPQGRHNIKTNLGEDIREFESVEEDEQEYASTESLNKTPESKESTDSSPQTEFQNATEAVNEKAKEQKEEEMVRETAESPQQRNFPERITYNPALSQRNTEATKWFGQPTAEDKIWMRPSGKVDENAEMERKRLIKAMTRRHNPHLVPKWQPPKEKDLNENLSERQKASLEKYENRRKSKTDSTSEIDFKSRSETALPSKEPSSTDSSPTTSSNSIQSASRENIVIESVVHSRDAISIWETRLSQKQQKEKLENQRLSVGKHKTRRDRYTSDTQRQSHDPNSSVSLITSAILPTSEHVERESMNVSQVRNRWKNIEESSRVKSPTNFKKQTTEQKKRSSFSVNTGATYRSYQRPAVAPLSRTKVVNAGPPVIASGPISHSSKNESFIDREIREAAEREEKWKQEQWEKMSEVSIASSEDVFPDSRQPLPSEDPKIITTIYTQNLPVEDLITRDIITQANREESWKEEHAYHRDDKNISDKTPRNLSKDSSGIESAVSAELSSPTSQSRSAHNQLKEMDSESLSSYGSSITGNEISSPPSLATIAQEKVGSSTSNTKQESAILHEKLQEAIDSGIECNSAHVSVESPQKEVQTAANEFTFPGKESETEDRKEAIKQRKRIASLTSPKGWESKIGSDNLVSPVHRSVAKPEIKSTSPPKINIPPPVTEVPIVVSSNSTLEVVPPGFEESTDPVISSKKEQPMEDGRESPKTQDVKQLRMEEISKNIEEITKQLSETENASKLQQTYIVQETKSSPTKAKPVAQKKVAHSFEITPSKSRLQTVMEKEMQEASAREEEWRKKQLELIAQGVDVSTHPSVHATREVRTPQTSTPPPPVNTDGPAPERRKIRSLFSEDTDYLTGHLPDVSSNDYNKKSVVKAMRVPKRKSNLAMKWEDGVFENIVPGDE